MLIAPVLLAGILAGLGEQRVLPMLGSDLLFRFPLLFRDRLLPWWNRAAFAGPLLRYVTRIRAVAVGGRYEQVIALRTLRRAGGYGSRVFLPVLAVAVSGFHGDQGVGGGGVEMPPSRCSWMVLGTGRYLVLQAVNMGPLINRRTSWLRRSMRPG